MFSSGYVSLLLLLGAGWWVPTAGIVGGGQQHSEEYQQRNQQVGSVYGDQQQAFLQRLGTSAWCGWELMEHDMTQDRDQCCGHMHGIHNGRGSDPLTATCKTTWLVKRLKLMGLGFFLNFSYVTLVKLLLTFLTVMGGSGEGRTYIYRYQS